MHYLHLTSNPNLPARCAKTKISVGGVFARNQEGQTALIFYVDKISAEGR